MKKAMATAPLGDDVYGEDPTVKKLQDECAKLLGQEAALVVPSGTMANICAILTHCTQKFQEVLMGDLSHTHLDAVGGVATLAGLQPRIVNNNPDGTLALDDLQSKIRFRSDPHYPWSKVVCLENTHNVCGGRVLSVDYIKEVRKLADANDLIMHLDGARVMNAATELQVPPSDIARHFDSVSMCFSKGLSCPVGSILAGSKTFIHRALWARKALGGGMRQAGVIAAPMLVALEEITPKLKDDHSRARKIAQAVADLGDESVMSVDMTCVQTNIVMLQITHHNVSPSQLSQRLKQVTDKEVSVLGEKIILLTVPLSETTLRFVTYHGITDDDIEKSIKKLQFVLKDMAKAKSGKTKSTFQCISCHLPNKAEDQADDPGEGSSFIHGPCHNLCLAVCRECFSVPIPKTPERPGLREFNTPLTDDNKTQKNQVEVIGGEDKYLAVCHECFTVPIPKTPERPALREFNSPLTDDNKLEKSESQRKLFS